MRITLSFKIMRRSLKIWFISAIGNFYSKSSYEFWKQGNNSWLQIQNILNEFNNQSDRRNATQENQWHTYPRSVVQHSFIQLYGFTSSLINNTHTEHYGTYVLNERNVLRKKNTYCPVEIQAASRRLYFFLVIQPFLLLFADIANLRM